MFIGAQLSTGGGGGRAKAKAVNSGLLSSPGLSWVAGPIFRYRGPDVMQPCLISGISSLESLAQTLKAFVE